MDKRFIIILLRYCLREGDFMITIRKATPEDALGISIVNVYTWKTTYSGLIPEDFINSRIEKVTEIAERNKREIGEREDKIRGILMIADILLLEI